MKYIKEYSDNSNSNRDDYDFKILSSPKNDRFYSYEYVLFIYPLKIDNHK
jgi:hypothetical protein